MTSKKPAKAKLQNIATDTLLARSPVLDRYVSMLQEIDLMFPDPDANGDRGGEIDVCEVMAAVRRAMADQPELGDRGVPNMIYAICQLSDAATDLQDVAVRLVDNWPQVKPRLNRHSMAQSEMLTTLRSYVEWCLRAAKGVM